jgi:hypothetical protein
MAGRYKLVFLGVAAVAAVVGFLGLLDIKNVPYSGYFSGPNNDIVRVFPESPAEQAGFQVGDVVESIGGIAVTDTKALSRRPRAEIGESRTFVVDRDGSRQQLDLSYSSLPSRPRNLGIAAALIGFCFLLLPLWAYRSAPSTSTLVLALFGLCFGAAFLPGPYSQSYMLRALAGALVTSAVVMGFAFLVHYVLQFPKPGAFLAKAWAKRLIYGPAILLALFFIFLTVAQPAATGGFNRIVGGLVGLFIVGFFGWAVVAMIRRYRAASASERTEHGLTLMLFGTLAGLLPLIFSSLVGTIAPQLRANLPGIQFFFLTLVLIPICFSVAAMRSAKA